LPNWHDRLDRNSRQRYKPNGQELIYAPEGAKTKMFDPTIEETKPEEWTFPNTRTQVGPSYLIVLFGFLFGCLLLILSAGVVFEFLGSTH